MELLQVINSANFLMLMRLLTRTMKETDDDQSDGNRNELVTTIMRTKRMMRMMKMMGMMRMMRMLRKRMKMKMSCCRVAKSIESSKRKPPNAIIVSRQVL